MRLRPLDPPIRYLIRCMPTTLLESSSKHPNDNRYLVASEYRRPWRPDVQIQTVFRLRIRVLKLGDQRPEDARGCVAVLQADGRVAGGVVRAVGLVGRFYCRAEAEVVDWGSPEGDAVPLVDVGEGLVDEACVRAGGGVHC